MCVTSMIMDHGLRQPIDYWYQPPTIHPVPIVDPMKWEDFLELLRKARKYDEEHGEPDCELDEKRQALKKLADQLGVEIAFP